MRKLPKLLNLNVKILKIWFEFQVRFTTRYFICVTIRKTSSINSHRETRIQNNQCSESNTALSPSVYFVKDKSFMGTVVNRILPFLNIELLETTLTVPLRFWKPKTKIMIQSKEALSLKGTVTLRANMAMSDSQQ